MSSKDVAEVFPLVPAQERRGLSDKQKVFAREKMVQLMQGVGNPSEVVEIFGRMREYDEDGLINAFLDSMIAHPDMNAEGEGFNNALKWAAINIKFKDVKNKNKYTESVTDKLNIDKLESINRLAMARGYGKTEDGRRFGDKRHTQIVDAQTKPEISGSQDEVE